MIKTYRRPVFNELNWNLRTEKTMCRDLSFSILYLRHGLPHGSATAVLSPVTMYTARSHRAVVSPMTCRIEGWQLLSTKSWCRFWYFNSRNSFKISNDHPTEFHWNVPSPIIDLRKPRRQLQRERQQRFHSPFAIVIVIVIVIVTIIISICTWTLSLQNNLTFKTENVMRFEVGHKNKMRK